MEKKFYIILDDLEKDARQLKEQLDTLPFLELIKITSTVEDTLALLITQKVDLLFLDLRLNGQNGLNLLQDFTTLPPVIIVSSYPEYAIDSYNIGRASDFIVKPFSTDRLIKAISRALSISPGAESTLTTNYVFVKIGRQMQRFELNQIDYIEAYGMYTKIISNGQATIVNERLHALTELLSERVFRRVHKSFLVNITKITRLDRNTLWIDTQKIPIGLAYRPNLVSLFRMFNIPEDTE